MITLVRAIDILSYGNVKSKLSTLLLNSPKVFGSPSRFHRLHLSPTVFLPFSLPHCASHFLSSLAFPFALPIIWPPQSVFQIVILLNSIGNFPKIT